ncbi:PLP-dependent aminotransferase family protein [Entomohabitans teleogrylli]|uniref:MocR-like transcription factor YczR n=1 Tax=Entomohabitans teleogrylli TaxID=1384589 RepID=UPI00073D316D|nr:PLP-dependent aminotransferase family protein [Entomohabitans teleogrylli]
MNQRRTGSASLVMLLGEWRQQHSRHPLWRQLTDGLRLLILDGRLPIGCRLPGERDLADALAVSRTTVSNALEQLRAEGYLCSRQGSGSVTMLPEKHAAPVWSTTNADIDLSTAALSAGPEIHQAYSAALTLLPEYLSQTGYDSQGLLPLREAIARRYSERGVPTTPDNILIVNGAANGLALLLRSFTGPGDRIAIDQPTWPLAISVIRGASCRPIPVPLAEQGWDTAGLAATIAQTAPRLAWLLPDFHNPTGRCMDSDTRARVADIAARTRTLAVADETMVDLWYEAPPPPPLAAFDREEWVITLGSTSKSFWGGLRVGWVRASPQIIATLLQNRDSMDLGTPVLEQLATAHLIDRGEQMLSARRAILRSRRDAMLQQVQRWFPEWQVTPPAGGLSLWANLSAPLASVFAAASENIGIHIGAGPRFGVDGTLERFLRLPFTLPEAQMEAVLLRLRPVWEQVSLRGRQRARLTSV